MRKRILPLIILQVFIFEVQLLSAQSVNSELSSFKANQGALLNSASVYNKIAFCRQKSSGSNEWNIYVMNNDGSSASALTSGYQDRMPYFNPAGTLIVFSRISMGQSNLYTMNPDGTNLTNITGSYPQLNGMKMSPRFSWDGTKISFDRQAGPNSTEIWTINANGTNPTRIVDGTYDNRGPSFSPDGLWLVYSKYLSPTTAKVCKVLISSGAVTELTNGTTMDEMPVYSPDGQYIIYQHEWNIYRIPYNHNPGDNTSYVNLTSGWGGSSGYESDAPMYAWDGSKIVFMATNDHSGNQNNWLNGMEIWTMNLDGSNRIQITSNSSADFDPSFSATVTAPSAPVAINASAITQTGFSANWNTVAGAAGYYLDVAADNGFTSYVTGFQNKDVGNVTAQSVTGLTANSNYFYRVRAYIIGGTSSNSNTITLTTLINVPAAPVALAATSVTQTSVIANWNSAANATGYYLDVAVDNGFTSYVTGFQNKDVGNATAQSVTGLTANSNYFYRVRAYNAGGASGNSNIINVITLPDIPSAPVATAATARTQTEFNANWNSVPGATGYYLDVASDNGFTNIITGYNNKDVLNVVTYTVSALTSNTAFYYRLRSYNVAGTSGNSNIIMVQPPVGIKNEESIPKEFQLNQCYPNPFNPSTTIKYAIPFVETGHAPSLQHTTLKVYDILGRDVVTLVDENKSPGKYTISFSADKYSLPSGIYFYQLVTKGFSQVKKMIVIK